MNAQLVYRISLAINTLVQAMGMMSDNMFRQKIGDGGVDYGYEQFLDLLNRNDMDVNSIIDIQKL